MNVRDKEVQAETIARVLDNAMALPGLRPKVGLDPVVGLFPIVGDTMATIGGAAILVMARQLQVPWDVQLRMAYNLFKNGLIGAIPLIGADQSVLEEVISHAQLHIPGDLQLPRHDQDCRAANRRHRVAHNRKQADHRVEADFGTQSREGHGIVEHSSDGFRLYFLVANVHPDSLGRPERGLTLVKPPGRR